MAHVRGDRNRLLYKEKTCLKILGEIFQYAAPWRAKISKILMFSLFHVYTVLC